MEEMTAPKTPTIPAPALDGSDVAARVVTAVADAEELSPMDLDLPLYEVVDPDALERLVESTDAALEVTFSYLGREVTVDGCGAVSVAR